jgi:hypothetical protein
MASRQGLSPRPCRLAYDAKYGFRDYRGGGRSSARETAARVAAGAVARLVIPEVTILAYVSQSAAMRSTWTISTQTRSVTTRSSAPTAGQPHAGKTGRRGAQGWLLARRGGRMRRHRRSRGLGRAALRKLDSELASRHDEHQRGQGRRDRRRLRRRASCVASRMPIRCGQVKTDPRSSSPIMRAASRAASRPASRSACASRSSRPARS